MAKKKETNVETKELKTKVQEGKAIIGTDRVLKNLKSKQIQTVYLASNCPDKIKDDVKYYAELAGTPIITLDYDNEELGVFCKKNFLVSVLGTIKE